MLGQYELTVDVFLVLSYMYANSFKFLVRDAQIHANALSHMSMSCLVCICCKLVMGVEDVHA